MTKDERLQKRADDRNKILKDLTPEQNVAIYKKIVVGGEKDVLRMLDRMGSKNCPFDEAYTEMERRRSKIAVAQALSIVGAFGVSIALAINEV